MANVSDADIAEYSETIQGLANKFTGWSGAEYDDLYQEGMISVWKSLEVGKVPSKDIIRRHMMNWIRKCRRGAGDSPPLEVWDEDDMDDSLSDILDRTTLVVEDYEAYKCLVDTTRRGIWFLVMMVDFDKAFATLDKVEREALSLIGKQGLTTREAGKIMGMSHEQVRRHYLRGLDNLDRRL